VRILVTGGAGFIGSHVVDALVARGHDVVVLDSLAPAVHPSRPDYLNEGAAYVEADLRDDDALAQALRGAEAVSHQAAMVGVTAGFADAPHYAVVNGVGTALLLRAAMREGVRRLVLASSMVVYGEGAYECPRDGAQRPEPRRTSDLEAGRFEPRCARCGSPLAPQAIREDAPLDPRSVYAATKVHQENLAGIAMREGGPAVTALRYHNVYGPRMPRDTPYAGVASIWRSQIAAGGAARVFEDGAQLRDFVHVSDVARANVMALELDPAPPGAFNVGSGTPRPILELAATLSRALGARPPVVTAEHRASDVRHVFASSEKAARELGFRAAVSFEDGVRELAAAPQRESVRRG